MQVEAAGTDTTLNVTGDATGSDLAMNVDEYRQLFPITREYAYLNHASIAPVPAPVAAAIERFLQRAQVVPAEQLLPDVLALETEVKERAARLINAARTDEMVQVPGTATGINIAAQGLPLRAGDNVLVLEDDYPAVTYPWLNLAPRGILTKFVPLHDGGLNLDVLASRIDVHTRAVCVSTAMFSTGFRNDIEQLGRLCRQRNLFLIVDAIQTLGCLPIDVQACGIDMLVAGSHKWLLGPAGSGIFYCRHEVLQQLQVGPYVGALSSVSGVDFLDFNFTLLPHSGRFAISAWPFLSIVAMHASLGLLLDVGINAIARRVLNLTAIAREDLEARGYRVRSNPAPRHRSGILIVEVPDPESALSRLLDAKISVAVRGGGVRLSPHFYNTEEEVCRVGAVLDGS